MPYDRAIFADSVIRHSLFNRKTAYAEQIFVLINSKLNKLIDNKLERV